MDRLQTVRELMVERGVDIAQVAERSGLDPRVVTAIVEGRYTTAPRQRLRLAQALAAAPEEIQWGSAVSVDHMYGHGPQFGRSP
jgi:hypothetical protein